MIWQRLLVVFSGADVYSATIVVVAFMLGLGCGSLCGGFMPTAFPGREPRPLCRSGARDRALRPQSKVILYDSSTELSATWEPIPRSWPACSWRSLLVPTFLMGMSLPLLGRALTRRLTGPPGHLAGSTGATHWERPLALSARSGGLYRDMASRALFIAAGFNFLCGAAVIPILASSVWSMPMSRARVEVPRTSG